MKYGARYGLLLAAFAALVYGSTVIFPSSLPAAANGGKSFTAFNLWYEHAKKVSCLNYKKGTMIPAGTEILAAEISTRRGWKRIRLTTKNGRSFMLYWNPKYHPGKTVMDYRNQLLTGRNFSELTRGMSDREIGAIRQGRIVKGMSKEAVKVCYGIPPEHATFSLAGNVWTYWTSRLIKKRIYFDAADRVASIRVGP